MFPCQDFFWRTKVDSAQFFLRPGQEINRANMIVYRSQKSERGRIAEEEEEEVACLLTHQSIEPEGREAEEEGICRP